MQDPLTAEERVQYNVLTRRIKEHEENAAKTLGGVVVSAFPQPYTFNTHQIYAQLVLYADLLIPALKPYARKDHSCSPPTNSSPLSKSSSTQNAPA